MDRRRFIFTMTAAGLMLPEQRIIAQSNVVKFPQPFLVIPFAKSRIKITEGWIYSDEERAIHGYENHRAIDFAAPRGTPVYAASDGWAISSSHIYVLPNKLYQGKTVGFALGNVVQVWHPDFQLFVQYAHLEVIAQQIAYIPPIQKPNGFWDPEAFYTHATLPVHKQTKIKQGDLIGYVGNSGLSWGYPETPRYRPDPMQYPSWDETHLHFEIFTRNSEGGKDLRYDPFGIQDKAEAYQSFRVVPGKHLWLLDKQGRPRFAYQ